MKFMQEELSQNWHLDKRVNVGHLLTTLTLAGSMFVWAMTIDSRVTGQEVRIVKNSEDIVNVEARSFRSIDAIRESMNRINDKLDRLIERQNK